MEPEITLIFVFIVTFLSLKFFKKRFLWKQSGLIALSAMLVVTTIGHVIYADGMEKMIPAIIPFKTEIVYLTGALELICAVTLLTPSLRKATGWILIAFFVLITPSNIYAAINHVNIETGGMDGDGINYLWYRLPLQLFFISWVYFFAIYRDNDFKAKTNKINSK